MSKKVDDKFFNRADAHIHLSNEQLSSVSQGEVSASMMYSVARFNAWISATSFENKEQMEERKLENIKYFVTEFEKMLEENFDDYIKNFDNYLNRKK